MAKKHKCAACGRTGIPTSKNPWRLCNIHRQLECNLCVKRLHPQSSGHTLVSTGAETKPERFAVKFDGRGYKIYDRNKLDYRRHADGGIIFYPEEKTAVDRAKELNAK